MVWPGQLYFGPQLPCVAVCFSNFFRFGGRGEVWAGTDVHESGPDRVNDGGGARGAEGEGAVEFEVEEVGLHAVEVVGV